MSWDAERSRSGKQPFQYVEIELDRCSRIYGDAFTSPPGSPLVGCQAQVGVTGADKCYNSWETCQDETNFNPLSFWVRFCEQTSDAPRSFNFDVASAIFARTSGTWGIAGPEITAEGRILRRAASRHRDRQIRHGARVRPDDAGDVLS